MKISLSILAAMSLMGCGTKEGDKIFAYSTDLTKTYEKKNVLGLIVADGNSLTLGEGAGLSYVDLLNSHGWNAMSVASSDKSCETIASEAADVVEPIKEKFESEEKAAADKAADAEKASNAETNTTVGKDETGEASLVIVWEGLNSFKAGKTPDEAYESLKEYVVARKENGWKTMLITMMYTTNQDLFYTQHIGPWRDQFNTLILENTAEADFVLDLQKDFRLSDSNVSTYFQADKLHLTKIGMRAIFENIQAEIVANGFTAPDQKIN